MSFISYMTPDKLAALDTTSKSDCVASTRAFYITSIVIVAVVVALRVYLHAKNLLWSDILILIAACFNLALAGVLLAATWKGFGQHLWNLGPGFDYRLIPRIEDILFSFFIIHILYQVSLALTKVSLVLTLVSVFGRSGRNFRVFMIGIAAAVVANGLVATFTSIFTCIPVQASWQIRLMSDAKCIDYIPVVRALTVVTIVTDAIICLVPMPYCWRLHLALRQRIFLSFVFAGGLVGSVYDIDITYNLVAMLNWSYLEVALGIVCASLPRLRPLFSSLGARMTGGGGDKKGSRTCGLETGGTGASRGLADGYSVRAVAVPRTAGSGKTMMHHGQWADAAVRVQKRPSADAQSDTVELCEIDLTPGAAPGPDGGGGVSEGEEETSQRGSEHSPEHDTPGTNLC
ncbi:hypothetical protein RB595_001920 [Gaeumannomyces hyphopodioides]